MDKRAGFKIGPLAVLFVILVLFIFLSLCLTNPEEPLEEDAFITFRYVENVLHGNGLVFNASERVEATSNFLWAVLLAALSSCGLSLQPTALILGLLSGILAIWTLWLFSVFNLERRGYFQFIAPLLLATCSPFVGFSAKGLETSFYTYLITLGTLCAVREQEKRKTFPKTFPYSALLFSLASMTRPEGVFLFLAMVVVIIAGDLTERRLSRYAVAGVLVFCLLYVPFLAFRLVYYRDIFPITLYARMAVTSDTGSILIHFLQDTKNYFIFSPVLSFFFKPRLRKSIAPLITVVMAFAVLLFLHRNYIHFARHAAPVFPLAFLLVQEGLFHLSKILEPFFCGKRLFKEGLLFLLALSILLVNFLGHEISPPHNVPDRFRTVKVNPMKTSIQEIVSRPSLIRRKWDAWYGCKDIPPNSWAQLGNWIGHNLPEGSIIMYDQMGQTPFYAGLGYVFIDSLGLTDRTIAEIEYGEITSFLSSVRKSILRLLPGAEARSDRKGPTFSEYFFARDPDFLFISTTPALRNELKSLVSSGEFQRRYEKFLPDTSYAPMTCYRRKTVKETS